MLEFTTALQFLPPRCMVGNEAERLKQTLHAPNLRRFLSITFINYLKKFLAALLLLLDLSCPFHREC